MSCAELSMFRRVVIDLGDGQAQHREVLLSDSSRASARSMSNQRLLRLAYLVPCARRR